MKLIKAKTWKGNDLKGTWEITLKIDGVRMLRDDAGNPVSRAGKPLHNLQNIPEEITDAEIYFGTWEESVSAVRTHDGKPVPTDAAYSLNPLDDRLVLGNLENPSANQILITMNAQVAKGYEGLILRQGDKWLRVKPKHTADVKVTGYQPGTGKHEGRMGALLTKYGKVGTGFTDLQRETWAIKHAQGTCVDSLIEVEYMEWTSGGKFRHPRFLRERTDKTEESVDAPNE